MLETAARRASHSALLSLLTASVFINYLDRGALSIAAPLLSREMSLSAIQIGFLFSAFFWSYSTTQLLAGWLVDRWNVYKLLSSGFILWSVATAIIPVLSSFAGLFCARLLLGIGESVAYPAYSSIVVENFSEDRRGFANSVLDAASKMGPVLSTAVGALTVQQFGWRPLFAGLACLSFAWLAPWTLWRKRSTSRSSPRIRGGVPFTALAKRRQVWITSLGMLALGYVWTFLLSWLPIYLVSQRGFSLHQVAVLGALPFAAMAVATLIAGWVSDRWIASGADVSRVRKTFINAGFIMCSLTILPVPFSGRSLAIILLTTSCACLGLFTSNVWAITQTLAGPAAAGAWSGIQNAIGNIGGIMSASLTGFAVYFTGSYKLAFVFCSAILLAGVVAYRFLGPIEGLEWNIDEVE